MRLDYIQFILQKPHFNQNKKHVSHGAFLPHSFSRIVRNPQEKHGQEINCDTGIMVKDIHVQWLPAPQE